MGKIVDAVKDAVETSVETAVEKTLGGAVAELIGDVADLVTADDDAERRAAQDELVGDLLRRLVEYEQRHKVDVVDLLDRAWRKIFGDH